jgi:hypothetical protein
MKIKVIILMLLISINLSFAQDRKIFPNVINLSDIDSTEINSSIWFELNYSSEQYKVISDGSIIIEKETFKSEINYEIDEGIFKGIDHGEWGGGLYYYSKGSSQSSYTILNENVHGIFSFNGSIYVLTGIAHLSINEGKLYRINKINNKWVVSESFELPEEPETYFVDKLGVYIVTFDSLCYFNMKKVYIILSKQFWASLYPSSVIIFEDYIAIGMRGCVALYSMNDDKIKYFR